MRTQNPPTNRMSPAKGARRTWGWASCFGALKSHGTVSASATRHRPIELSPHRAIVSPRTLLLPAQVTLGGRGATTSEEEWKLASRKITSELAGQQLQALRVASSSLSLEALALPPAELDLSPPATPRAPATPKDEVVAAFAAGLTRQRLTPEQQRERERQARRERSEHKQALRQHLGAAILLQAKAYAAEPSSSGGATSLTSSPEPLDSATPRDSPALAAAARSTDAQRRCADAEARWAGVSSTEAAPARRGLTGGQPSVTSPFENVPAEAETPPPRFQRAGRSSTDDVEVELGAFGSSNGKVRDSGGGGVRSPGKPSPASPRRPLTALQPSTLLQL